MKESNWSLGADLTVKTLAGSFFTPVLANGAPEGDQMPAHAFGSTKELSIERARLISAAPDLFGVLADIIDGAPTEEELSGVRLKPGQQIKLSLLIDSAKIRTARAAIAKATKGGAA